MYAVFEVCDKEPSGTPEQDWGSYVMRDRKFSEKRLLGTRYSAKEAKAMAETMQQGTTNDVYYQEIP